VSEQPGFIATIRGLPAPVWALFIGTFVNRFGGFVIVFMVLFLTKHGFSPAQAGIAVAVAGAGSVGGSALGGLLADRIGRRETIALSMVSSAIVTMAIALVDGYLLLILLSGLFGLTSQIVRAPTGALIADLVPPESRVAAMGVLRFFLNAGFAAGPAAAGILADRSFLLLFSLDAATSLIFGVIAMALLPAGAPRSEHRERRGEGTRTILADRAFVLFLVASLFAAMVYLQAETTLPLWITGLGYSNSTYGYLISLNGVVIIVVELVLISKTQRMSPRWLIAGGFLLVGVGFALTAVAHTLIILAVTVLIWTLGEMTAFPMSTAYVANVAPRHLRGRYQGTWGLTWSLGLMIGPGIGGWLFTVNPVLLWILCGVAGVVAAGLMLVAPVPRSDESEPDPELLAQAPVG
jgi:MFS family permease